MISTRAVLVDLTPSIEALARNDAISSLSISELMSWLATFKDNKDDLIRLFTPVFSSFLGDARVQTHSPLAFGRQRVTQLLALDWDQIKGMSKDSKLGPLLSAWSATDVDIDAQLGICALPVYKMAADDVDKIKGSSSLDVAKELLSRHGCWEYFFPNATDLTLGLIDRGVDSNDGIRDGLGCVRKVV